MSLSGEVVGKLIGVAAVVGVLAYAWYKFKDVIWGWLKSAGNAAGKGWKWGKDHWKDIAGTFGPWAPFYWGYKKRKEIVSTLVNTEKYLADKGVFKWTAGAAKTTGSAIATGAVIAGNAIASGATVAGNAIASGAVTSGNAIGSAVVPIANTVGNAVVPVANTAGNAIGSTAVNLGNTVGGAVRNIPLPPKPTICYKKKLGIRIPYPC
jgi:hypothetical protein